MAKLSKKVGKNRGTGADLVQIVNGNTSRYTTRLEFEQKKNSELMELAQHCIALMPITADILEQEVLRRTAGNADPELQQQVQYLQQVVQDIRDFSSTDQKENQ